MSTLLRLTKYPSLQFLFALLVYFLATAAITSPFFTRLDQTLFNWGDALLQTWTLGWNAQQFLLDPLHLYDAPTFYPYPFTLAFTDTLVPQSALALPLILATNHLTLAHNLSILVAYVLNGANMYLLLRWWKLSFWGALTGGFIYAFGHYHLSHFGHLDLLSSQWLPLVLLFFDLALERKQPRFFILLGLAFILTALSAFYYAFFATVVVLCYAAVRAWQGRRTLNRRAWLGVGATFAIAALILLPFGLPYISLAREFGLTRPLSELQRLSAVPASYLTIQSVNEPFAQLIPFFPQVHPEAVLSPGIVALALALVGTIRRKVWQPATALIVIGFVGFVLSLGPAVQIGTLSIPLPNQFLYTNVPGFAGAMRAISRWGLVVLFAVAGLAGFAMDELLRRIVRRITSRTLGGIASPSRAWLVPVLGVLVLGLLYWEYDQAPVRLMTGTLLRETPSPLYGWLKAQIGGAAVELPMGESGAGTANDFWYQYYTLLHRHRIVNGSSGFAPLTYDEIKRRLENFPTAEGIELLRALDVRYVIMHTDALENRDALTAQLALYHDALRIVQTADADIALELAPLQPANDFELEFVAPASILPNVSAPAYVIAKPTRASSTRLSERGLLDLQLRWYDASNILAKTENVRVTAPLLLDEHGAVMPFKLTAPTQTGLWRLVLDVRGADNMRGAGDLRGADEARTVEQTVEVTPAFTQADPPIQLLSAFAGTRAARAGETLKVMLTWRVWAKPAEDYQVFLHVDDDKGNTRAQLDFEPFYGALPTTQWEPGQILVEQYEIPLANGLPQNQYHLVAGLFHAASGRLIPMRGPDDQIETAVAFDTPVWIGAGRAQKPLTPPIPLRAEFDNAITLLGYELASTQFKRGATISPTLFWQARLRPLEAYTVFVHLVDQDGKLVAQSDAPPRGGTYPTTAWNDGEYVRDPHPLALPSDLPAGEYTLRVGWYNPADGARAHVQTNDGAPADFVTLAHIIVTEK